MNNGQIKNTGSFLALSPQWFEKNQTTLLKLLNWKITKRLFRWILRITKDDVGYNATIVKIEPNSYTVVKRFLGENVELITDFRTHPKYGKRLYYAFKPMWWAMHYWDEIFADRYAPQWSYGFSTLTSYPDAGNPGTTTCDGIIRHIGDDTFANKIAFANGTGIQNVAQGLCVRISATLDTDYYNIISRSRYLFDTSSIDDSATISAAVFSLFGVSKIDTYSPTVTPNIDVYTSSAASDTTLDVADYSQFGTTSQTGSPITYANFSTSAYNDFTFNATGISNVSKTGISKFGVRNANYDVAENAPTWTSVGDAGFTAYFADQTGTDNDPKLVVTYSTVVGPANVKTYMGLAAASTKTVDGLAIASIKTWGGIV